MEYCSAIKKNKIMPFAATWMELDNLIPSEVWNRIYAQMNLFTEKKIMDLENRLVVAKGEGKGVGWIGSLGLIDALCCLGMD